MRVMRAAHKGDSLWVDLDSFDLGGCFVRASQPFAGLTFAHPGCEQPHLIGPICKLVHDWPLVHRHEGLRRWWAIAQSTMGSFGIVVVSPSFDNDLSFAQRVEDFAV